MRLVLFVQREGELPRCADEVWPASGWHRSRMTKREQRGDFMFSPLQLSEMDSAERWWLVEVEK